jgi:hypothetical protein
MRFLSTCARTLAVALHLLTSLHGPIAALDECDGMSAVAKADTAFQAYPLVNRLKVA